MGRRDIGAGGGKWEFGPQGQRHHDLACLLLPKVELVETVGERDVVMVMRREAAFKEYFTFNILVIYQGRIALLSVASIH